ncbi:MAG: lysophospholipid acyltransferase family protein [Candidatus Aminicenantales bacterium]
MDLIFFGFLRVLSLFFRLLPRSSCLRIGQAFGELVFRLDRKHRRLALANLETAFGPAADPAARRRLARDSFRHFGRVTADNLKWIHLRAARRTELLNVEGKEHIRQVIDAGRGGLIFTAHFGNWEVAAEAVAALAPLNVVARPLDNPLVEAELVRFRRRLGARIISKFQAAKPILQALHRNELVAILIDQNVLRSQAVFVDFFGRPAGTTPGLASFHLRTRSPLIPVFCLPGPRSTYRVRIGEPLTFDPSGDFDGDVLKITRACTKMIETEIRKNPGLWFWFHNRWKTRPEEKADPAGPNAGNFASKG